MNVMRSLALLLSLIPAVSFGMGKGSYNEYFSPEQFPSSSSTGFNTSPYPSKLDTPAYTPDPAPYFQPSHQEYTQHEYSQKPLLSQQLFHCAMSGNFSEVTHEIKKYPQPQFGELLDEISEYADEQFNPTKEPGDKADISLNPGVEKEEKSRIIERIQLLLHLKEEQANDGKEVDPVVKARIIAIYHAVDASLKPYAPMPFSMKMAFLSAPEKAGVAGMTLLAAFGAYKIVDWLFAKPARTQMAMNMPQFNNDAAYTA